MAVVANKRSVMSLYSGSDVDSHMVRFVLAEKGLVADIIELDPQVPSESLLESNPYGNLPTLIDRDLTLYEPRLIVEYLDERFPHPPLLPVDPVSRARARLYMYRVQNDWYQLLPDILYGGEKKVKRTRKILKERLLESVPIFEMKPFFMHDDFTLADCKIAPLLWRLSEFGIDLGEQGKAITDYAKRMFAREGFQSSLTNSEEDIIQKF